MQELIPRVPSQASAGKCSPALLHAVATPHGHPPAAVLPSHSPQGRQGQGQEQRQGQGRQEPGPVPPPAACTGNSDYAEGCATPQAGNSLKGTNPVASTLKEQTYGVPCNSAILTWPVFR